MLDGIPVGPILLASSPWVLLSMVGYLIVRGHLATPRQVQRMEEEIKWLRETLSVSEQARIESLRQSDQLLGSMATVESIVRAIPQYPPRGGRGR